MMNIIKSWLSPIHRKLGMGYLSVGIPDPLREEKPSAPPLYVRKHTEMRAVKWSVDMGPRLLESNLFPAGRKALPPLLGLTPGGDFDAEPFKSIPDGAWVIFCPKIGRLWWISAAHFTNFYYQGKMIAQQTYLPRGAHWNNFTYFDVVEAHRKKSLVHAVRLRTNEKTVFETLKDLELRLNRGTSLTVWAPQLSHGNEGDWIVVDRHNYVWVVEGDAFDSLYEIVESST